MLQSPQNQGKVFGEELKLNTQQQRYQQQLQRFNQMTPQQRQTYLKEFQEQLNSKINLSEDDKKKINEAYENGDPQMKQYIQFMLKPQFSDLSFEQYKLQILHQEQIQQDSLNNKQKTKNPKFILQEMQKKIEKRDATQEEKKILSEQYNSRKQKPNAKAIFLNVEALHQVEGKQGQQKHRNQLVNIKIVQPIPLTEFSKDYRMDAIKQILEKGQNKNIELVNMNMHEKTIKLKSFLVNIMQGVLKIDFTNCNFTNEDIETLVQRCDRLPHLLTLILNNNRFTHFDKKQLTEMKQKMPYLGNIQIKCNKESDVKLDYQSTKEIIEFMFEEKNNNNREFIIVLNRWDLSFDNEDKNITSINYSFLQGWNRINPEALRYVQQLNISNQPIENKGMEFICNKIVDFPQLKKLNLSNTSITTTKQESLRQLDHFTESRQHALHVNLMQNQLDQQSYQMITKVFNKENSKVVIDCDQTLKFKNILALKEKKIQFVSTLKRLFQKLAQGLSQQFVQMDYSRMDGLIQQLLNFYEKPQYMQAQLKRIIQESMKQHAHQSKNINDQESYDLVQHYRQLLESKFRLYEKFKKKFGLIEVIRQKLLDSIIKIIKNQSIKLGSSNVSNTVNTSTEGSENVAQTESQQSKNECDFWRMKQSQVSKKVFQRVQVGDMQKQIFIFQILEQIYQEKLNKYRKLVQEKQELKNEIDLGLKSLLNVIDKANSEVFGCIEILKNNWEQIQDNSKKSRLSFKDKQQEPPNDHSSKKSRQSIKYKQQQPPNNQSSLVSVSGNCENDQSIQNQISGNRDHDQSSLDQASGNRNQSIPRSDTN